MGVNSFMYWKLMEWASKRGLRVFDFGRSRKGTGAAKFKKNMGFEAETLSYQYHLGPGGTLPDLHPGNPKVGIYQSLPTGRAMPCVDGPARGHQCRPRSASTRARLRK